MLTSKLSPDVRTSPMRQRIYDAVMAKPGRTFMDVVQAVGIAGNGTAQYHLYVLERFGLIHHVKAGRSVHYYPTGAVAPKEAREDAFTTDETRRTLLKHVRTFPGLSLGALSSLFPATRQNTSYHVDHLARQGLLVVREDEDNRRTKRVYPVADQGSDGLGCAECRQGPCSAALMPGESCAHGCGCAGLEVPA